MTSALTAALVAALSLAWALAVPAAQRPHPLHCHARYLPPRSVSCIEIPFLAKE